MKTLICIVTYLFVFMGFNANADYPANNSEAELERWFNSNEEDISPKPSDISDGELKFLDKAPETSPHLAENTITILPRSLDDGWVRLNQCHQKLDMMPAAQIVYLHKPVRKLKVTQQHNIKKSYIDNNTVQLEHIGEGARICVEAEIEALSRDKDNTYVLDNGPFLRKFLDGYFPVSLQLSIHYPDKLQLIRTDPQEQPGVRILKKPSSLTISALFEGILQTRTWFKRTPSAP